MSTKSDDQNCSRRWVPTSWPLGPFVFGATGLVALIGIITCWLLWLSLGGSMGKTSALFDLARATVTLLGVLTIGGAAAVAYRRQQSLEEQGRLDQGQEARAKRTDLHARYQQAAAQLGHDEPIIRIAGVYALEALAVEWATLNDTAQRDVCIDLLCGYLRSAKGIDTTEQRPIMDQTEKDVRFTLATVLARHLYAGDHAELSGDWSDHSFDFTNAHFTDARFVRAHFDAEAKFSGACFHAGAWFVGAHFTDARFVGAHFRGITTFDEARIHDDAQFLEVNFDEVAHFSDAHFDGIAWFANTVFQEGGEFGGAEFEHGALFNNVHFLADAMFDDAQLNRQVSFVGVHFLGNTGFDRVSALSEVQLDCVHFHERGGLNSLERAKPRLTGVRVTPRYLTPGLRELGVTELPPKTTCSLCSEALAARPM